MASTETTETVGIAHQQLMVAMNEWTADDLAPSQLGEFACECEDRGCVHTVSLPLAEYMDVRGAPGRFVISPTHHGTGDHPVGLVVVPGIAPASARG